RPEVEVLPSVKSEAALVWRDPAGDAEVEGAVVAGDIDIRVMDDNVLPVPQVRAAPDQVERHRRQLVDRGVVGVRVMAAVVLTVEADTDRGPPEPERGHREQDGPRHTLPPRVGHEPEQQVRDRQTGEEDRRLQIHLPAVAAPPAGDLEILVDSSPKLDLEGAIRPEFESSSRGHQDRSPRRYWSIPSS